MGADDVGPTTCAVLDATGPDERSVQARRVEAERWAPERSAPRSSPGNPSRTTAGSARTVVDPAQGPLGGRARLPRRIAQLVRYGAVSVVATATSLTVLGVLVASGALPAALANVVATAVGTVPSFELNRRWVWRRTGARAVLAEVVPFTVLSFLGLALSTIAVAVVASWATAAGLTSTTRTVAVELANLSAFGALWLAQFVVLDRWLFRTRAPLVPAVDTP
jgi:putative flippase GtrA